MAIEDQAITSPKGSEPKLGRVSSRLNVTLMLTVEQAEKLQSAKNQASIALAMRNPQETPIMHAPGEEASSVAAGSYVGPQTRVNSYAEIEDSIIFSRVNIGRNARIRRAIIDKGVHIPEGARVGYDPDEDKRNGYVMSPGGVVVIAKAESFEPVMAESI